MDRTHYVQYDRITGNIIGFYMTSQKDFIPNNSPYIGINEKNYNAYFEGVINGKSYKVIDGELKEFDIREEMELDDYKLLKNAYIIYEARKRNALPFEYSGNFYDVYFLRNNYFDQRFIESISKNNTNEIKLTTINGRMVVMTSEDFFKFYHSYTQYTKAINDKQIELLDNVFDAKDKDEVDAVIWEDDINATIYPTGSIFMPLTDTSNSYMNIAAIFNSSLSANNSGGDDSEETSTNILLADAPIDNNIYGRKNCKWINLFNHFITKDDFPPNDDKIYALRNGEWVAISKVEVIY